MFMVGIFQWWYGEGLRWYVRRLWLGMLRTADFFSIGLMAQTLFNPFRQISAGAVNGPLPVQLRAWSDRLFSRFIGMIMRLIMIFIGMFAIFFRFLWSFCGVVAWIFLPISPVLGIIFLQMRFLV